MFNTPVKFIAEKLAVEGGDSTLDLCYASSEEIPELQRPRRATGNRRNLR